MRPPPVIERLRLPWREARSARNASVGGTLLFTGQHSQEPPGGKDIPYSRPCKMWCQKRGYVPCVGIPLTCQSGDAGLGTDRCVTEFSISTRRHQQQRCGRAHMSTGLASHLRPGRKTLYKCQISLLVQQIICISSF